MLKKILNQEDKEKAKERNKENVPKKIIENVIVEKKLELEEDDDIPGLEDPPKTNGHHKDLNESIKDDLSALQDAHFDDDDFSIEDVQSAEKVAQKQPKKFELVKDEKKPIKITDKPINYESTILNELQGIDFNQEIEMDASGVPKEELDLNKVSGHFYF